MHFNKKRNSEAKFWWLIQESGAAIQAYVIGLYICSPAAALLSYTIEEAGVIATEENQSDGSSGGGGI